MDWSSLDTGGRDERSETDQDANAGSASALLFGVLLISSNATEGARMVAMRGLAVYAARG
jgi:hypothetical protein